MKSSMLRKALVVCGLMGMSLMAQFALAQDSALSKNVTLYLRDADLLSATRQLTQLTGLNFTFLPSEKPFAKINLSLENVSAEDAIRYICQAAGAHAERDERGIFIIRSGEAREAQAITNSAPVSEKLIVREIEIRKADPRDVMDLLIYGDVQDPERLTNDMWNARQRISNGISSSSGMPSYSKATTFDPGASNSPTPNDEGLRLPNIDSNQRAGGAGGGGGQPGGLGGGGGQPGGGGLGGGGQAGGGGSFAGATGGQGLIPEGTTSLTYNPATNELIFRGTSQAYQELLGILGRIDKAPKQVVVKVEFITTSQSFDRSLGIDWIYERGGIFAGNRPGAFASAADPVFLNYATGNITTRLRTGLTEGKGRVVTAPVVRTLNNQSAFVAAGTLTALFLTENIVSNGTVVSQTRVVTINVTSFLNVKPRINGDNTITMTLQPQITNITGIRTGPDGTTFPEQSFQTIQVAIRVRNGETIALGGLTGKSDNFQSSRIPLLSDLPVIGQLFKRRQALQSTNELIIFVTASIIDEGQSGLGIP